MCDHTHKNTYTINLNFSNLSRKGAIWNVCIDTYMYIYMYVYIHKYIYTYS
jgi:hypothetical protein